MKKFPHIMIFAMLILVFTVGVVKAQIAPVPILCGTTLEAELVKPQTTDLGREEHKYSLKLRAGDTINVEIAPVGTSLTLFLRLYNPANSLLWSNWSPGAGQAETMQNLVVDATGNYIVAVGANTIGAYDMSIGCVLRDGTLINPGDTLPDTTSTSGTNADSSVGPTFSGTGFPGLAPVDFVGLAPKSLVLSTPVIGAVAPDGNAITAYTFDAAANDNLALSFTRLSGNLNLGLVVLSADNKVVFQASLVTSSELTTKFTLPTAGTYTIGIFRIDLLPPGAPEATAFQLTATLNP